MRDLDYTVSVAFLRKFFAFSEDLVELRCILNDGGGVRDRVFIGQGQGANIVGFCQINDVPGRAVYFGCSTRAPGSRQGRKEDLSEIVCAHVDIDCYKPGLELTVEEVMAALLGCLCPPSLIVASGWGVHAYWLLREASPAGDGLDDLEIVLKRLAEVFAGDPLPAQAAAIMRLPGTHNSKKNEWRDCAVLEDSERLYELSDLAEMLDGLPPQLSGSASIPAEQIYLAAATAVEPFEAFAAIKRMDIEAELAAMQLHDPGGRGFGVHRVRRDAAASMVARGHEDQVIFDRLMAETERAYAEAGEAWPAGRARLEAKRLRDEISSAHAKGWAPKMAPEAEIPGQVVQLRPGQQERQDDDPLPVAMPATRPVIFIKAGELAATADQAERILVETRVPFYDRAGKLMRPIVREATASDKHTTKVARLELVNTTFMVDTLSKLIEWRKFDKRSKSWVRCDPPTEIADTLLKRAGTWSFPQVLAVITAPTLRPDGSIVLEEGYDPATQLILLAPPAMPSMPHRPSKADAEAALAILDELLDEFCFVDEPSRAVAMSALISPIVRGALLTVPAHVVRAPTAGTGKTYLVEVSSAMSSGRRCQALAVPKNDEEFEKRIGAVLIGGQAAVAFDNLNGELRGNALCHMVERPLVQIRPLGFSQMIDIEQRVCVFATGNNITIVGDLVRRSLLASLDAQVERPELKQYNKRPFDAVLLNRGKHIAAALTVVRAYQEAGFPDLKPELASFADWSKFVRSALVWLGMADPADTIEKSRENDPDLAVLNDVVEAWYNSIGLNITKSAGELTKMDELRDALMPVATGASGNLDAGKLGRWLTMQKDKTVGEVRITASGKGGHHGRKWTLLSAKIEGEP